MGRGPTAARGEARWSWRRVLRRALPTLLLMVAPVALFELLLTLTDLDLRVMARYAYRNEGNEAYVGDRPLYRLSADPERIYELVPGARVRCAGCAHPAAGRNDPVEYSINGQGFRGRELPEEKGAGTFRIFILGGSNTFGLSVGDDESYPARIQARLEQLGHSEVEVWNAGVNAYVISQKVAYLQEIVRRYEPDLVLLQDHNRGWRPHLRGEGNVVAALRANPALVVEGLPAAWGDPGKPHELHEWLVTHLRSYRAAWAVYLYLAIRHWCAESVEQSIDCLPDSWAQRFGALSDRHSLAALEEAAATAKAPLILLDTVGNRYCPGSRSEARPWELPALRTYSFCDLSKPAAYYHIHPPAYVYEWYATRLVDDIILPELQRRRR